MAHIDTYNYFNGELRLSRHGARRGGDVLMHVPTGRQLTLHPSNVRATMRVAERLQRAGVFSRIAYEGFKSLNEGCSPR